VTLLPSQDRLLFTESRYPAFIGGVGSGKTMGGCLKAVLECKPGSYGAIIAPTYPMLRDVAQATFLSILDTHNLRYEHWKTDGIITVNGALVYLRSGDNPERLRGLNLAWAYIDEAALAREAVWNIVLGRLRHGESRKAWITTTPAGFNWVYRRWQEKQREGYEIIHASTRENKYLPTGYIDDLVASYTSEYAKQEIDGEFVAFEGLVYSEFRQQVHVTNDEIPDTWERIRGVDYGYTNPFVCLWGALDSDGRLYIYDEHYMSRRLIREHASAIMERESRAYRFTVADWDAQENAEMSACGISTVRARKDIISGLQKVKARLAVQPDGRPRLYIHERCVNTLRELSMYRWDTGRTGTERETPVKELDHAMDALRYMVMEVDAGGFVIV
jgi:PBSX family phage terminase large subunit